MRRLIVLAALALPLAACGSRNAGESAADYAGKIGGAQAAATPAAATPGSGAAPATPLPRAAPDGKQAVDYSQPYTQAAPDNGVASGLTINKDGTYVLVENGKTTRGRYEWLADGKRLRLRGIEYRPIVLVANGALYRLTNENVPIDDVTPDRMYKPGSE